MAEPFVTNKRLLAGAAGDIEIAEHLPESPRAVAVVAHPHPLFAGTMDNKVVTTLARAMFDLGAATYRFNFRGVGKSSGVHDNGRGETEDLLRVIDEAAKPGLPIWVGGFSFGGAVALAASEHRAFDAMVLVAPAFARMSHWSNVESGGRPPASTLLMHGEKDETVPLADSLTWALPRELAVTVIPGADHFFHGRLAILKSLTTRHLQQGS